MKIDFTLVVQAINFGIAYVMIRKLLLEPAVEAIEADSAQKRVLNHKIETATLANGSADERMKKHWQEYRVHVREKVPAVVQSQQLVADLAMEEITVEPVDTDYANYLVKVVTKEVVERVDHVRS